MIFSLNLSFLQAPDEVSFTPCYPHHEHISVSYSGLTGIMLLAESFLCWVLSHGENIFFSPHQTSPMERGWHFLILACVRVVLPAFKASRPPSFFLGEEHTYVVCTYGVFSPLPLGALSVASCFTPVAAPSTRAASDLWVGAGGSPSCGHAKKEKGFKKIKIKINK